MLFLTCIVTFVTIALLFTPMLHTEALYTLQTAERVNPALCYFPTYDTDYMLGDSLCRQD